MKGEGPPEPFLQASGQEWPGHLSACDESHFGVRALRAALVSIDSSATCTAPFRREIIIEKSNEREHAP